MGRRHSAPVNRNIDGYRTSIGDSHCEEAARQLDLAAKREIQIMLNGRYDAKYMLAGFYNDESVKRLIAVKGEVVPSAQWHQIKLNNSDVHPDMGDDQQYYITTYFNTSPAVTPTEQAQEFHPERVTGLFEDIKLAHAIRAKYARVKWFVSYLNRNWTPAAIRVYWPSVLTLCKAAPICADYAELPSRYNDPGDLGTYLPLIRDTAGTVAAMQMIPEVELRPREEVSLTFSSGTHRQILEDTQQPYQMHFNELIVQL